MMVFRYFLSLLAYSALVNSITLLARTSKSVVRLEIDVKNESSSSSKVLMDSIQEEDNILLASNEKENLGYYLLHGNLYSINLEDFSIIEKGKVGVHIHDYPSTMDYDWLTNTLYIGVQGNHESSGRIEACTLKNVSICTAVLHGKLDYLYSLILDPVKGKMFWESGVSNNIEMGSMDGMNHEREPFNIPSATPSTYRSLSYHWRTNRLYFIKSSGNVNEIVTCEVNTARNCSIVASAPIIVNLAVSENHIVWSMSVKGVLMYCEIQNCSETIRETIFHGIENFIVIDRRKTEQKASHNCFDNNDGCSDFCLIGEEKTSSRCACPIGVALEEDGKTCNSAGVKTAIFVSSLNGIFKVSLDSEEFVSIPFRFQNEQMTNIDDIEYDPNNRFLYWIEDEDLEQKTRFIRRSSVDNPITETVVSVPSTVKKIRFDEQSQNLFWLDEAAGSRIGMTSLTSFYSKTIIFGSAKNIKSFALYEIESAILVARNDYNNGLIEKYSIDGTKLGIVQKLPRNVFISDMNFNNDREVLYWIETDSNDLAWMSLETMNTGKVVFDSALRLPQLNTIELMGNDVFLNSLLGRSILKVSMENIDSPVVTSIETPIFGAKGMKAVNFGVKRRHSNNCHKSNGFCEHICIASQSRNHNCTCADGFYYDGEVQRCLKLDSFALVLHGKNQISVMSTVTPAASPLLANYDELISNVASIGVDTIRSEILVAGKSKSGDGIILKCQMPKASTVGRIEPIIKSKRILEDESLIGIYELAVDKISGNIFWTNSISEQIEVCDSTGKYRKVLAWKQIKPRSIAVDDTVSSLIYYDANDPPSLKRMGMSGDPTGGYDIAPTVSNVLSLGIDARNQMVYWVEISKTDSYIISSMSSYGNGREYLYAGKDRKPISVSALGSIPYFMETSGKYGKLVRHTGRTTEEVYEIELEHPKILKMVNRIDYLTAAEKNMACYNNQGRCEHLCLDEDETTTLTPYTTERPFKEVCKCSDHFHFNNGLGGMRQCLPYTNTILAVKKTGFYQAGLRKLSGKYLSWNQDPIIRIPVNWKDGRIPKSIGYHPTERMIFWIDNHDYQLNFVKLSESETTHTTSAKSTPVCLTFHSLAVDPVGNQVLVSCYRNSTGYIVFYKIMENPISLKYVDVLISGETISSFSGWPTQPREIAVFPLRNLFFFVDVPMQEENPCSIVKCTLDGKRCSIWLNRNVSPMSKLQADPNIENSRLFYTNSYGVWSRDLASSEANIQHHYGSFSVGKEYSVAPIDENSAIVARIVGEASKVFDWPSNETVWDLSDSLILHRSASFDVQSHVCKAAQCSHMCRYVRDKDAPTHERFECLCPQGTALSHDDKKMCVVSVTCSLWQFGCANGRECIHSSKKCDGVNDCSDHSDEARSHCGSNLKLLWACDDGSASVNRTSLCDGVAHCADASDELHCRCERPHDFFDCAAWTTNNSRKCVPRRALCDGVEDCESGEDEKNPMCSKFEAYSREDLPLLYIFLFMMTVFLFIALLFLCCFKSDKDAVRDVTSATSTERNENTTLLQQNFHQGSNPPVRMMMEPVVSRDDNAYSVADSNSTFGVLPRPHSENLEQSSINFDLPPQRFYAPPSSQASLSTYGIVKPAEHMRLYNRTKGRRRKHAVGPSSSEDEDTPRTSTPRNLSKLRQRTPSSNGGGTRPPQLPFTPITLHVSTDSASHSSEMVQNI